jgi:hypothetical protein
MALKAGVIRDTNGHPDNADSMAQAIENAFIREWPNAMGGQPAPEHNKQMQLLFVAVAQGIIDYLAVHPEAFKIEIDLGSGFRFSGNLSAIERI